MSGECYLLRESVEIRKDSGNGHQVKGKVEMEKIGHLAEYEHSVMNAQNKCVQLKGQLERLKDYYSSEMTKKRDSSNKSEAPTTTNRSVATDVTGKDLGETVSAQKPYGLPRQSSNMIGTENPQAALGTIGSILAGITETIRNNTDIYDRSTMKHKTKSSTQSTPKQHHHHHHHHKHQQPVQRVQKFSAVAHGVETVKIHTKSRTSADMGNKSHSKIKSVGATKPLSRVSSKMSSKTSTHTLPKTKVSLVSRKNSSSADKSSKSGHHHQQQQQKDGNNSNSVSNIVTPNDGGATGRKKSKKVAKKQRSQIFRSWAKSNKATKKNSPQDLVEIYHNVAVKESNSSDSNDAKNKINNELLQQQQQHQQQQHQHQQQTPQESGLKEHQSHRYHTNREEYYQQQQQQHQQQMYQHHQHSVSGTVAATITTSTVRSSSNNHAINNMMRSEPTAMVPPLDIYGTNTALSAAAHMRNYEQPTISSRLKQAAKFYFNSFSAIPFCAAKSVNPSHNIGINIQQMMNMMKHKHSTRLSPTLAYKIGCVADNWDFKTLPALPSEISTRFGSQCPISKMSVNYQYLQEMAKTIPQETIEEVDEDVSDCESPDTRSLYITGPSGDVKVRNKKQTCWTADKEEPKCICQPKKGREFQQIIEKQQCAGVPSCSNTQKKMTMTATDNHSESKEDKHCSVLDRQKKLKDVLGKLHDEFNTMNKKYEDLAKKSEDKVTNSENMKRTNSELERLEKDLNSKEEEIVMVMSLYEEVLALKNQVRNLKERNSKEVVNVKSQVSKLNGYSNANATGMLQRLLKQVQQFHSHYNSYKKV